MADFELLTIGMIIDLLIEFTEEYERANGGAKHSDQSGARMATQADFDRF